MTEFLDACYEAIRKQETSISDTIRNVDDVDASLFRRKRHIVLTGCGDSFAVADYGKWAFLKVGLNAIAVSPLTMSYLQLDDDCLVIGVTASGRSIAILDALREAKSSNATTVVLTDNAEGNASSLADYLWVTQSGVVSHNISPSSVTTTAMAYLLKLAVQYHGVSNIGLQHDLDRLAVAGKEIVGWAEEVGNKIAEIISPDSPLYTISDGPNHVAAQIGMMKFNEYSIVHSFAALREDFRHHHVLTINEGDSAVFVSDSPPNAEDKRYLAALSENLGMNSYHLFTPEELLLESPLGQTIANSIALQMAAYYHVIKHDPNKPNWKKPNVDAFKIY
ncbi:MAG: SIS domain-containing protein [Candidatus Hodarchaeota archaeon]